MTTTKSFSKAGRLRQNYISALRRQLPFAITSAVLVFAFVVLPYLVDAPDHTNYYSAVTQTPEMIRAYYLGHFQSGVYIDNSLGGVVAMLLAIMAFAGALASSRYLHSKKMTDLYHSLPLTRGQLLVTNMAATLTAILGPFAVLYLATAVGQQIGYAKYGCFGLPYLQALAADLALTLLYVWVVYLVTTLVAVNVGTTIDALMISGALGFLPSVVYVVGGYLWTAEYYGAAFGAGKFLSLNPFLFFMQKYFYTTDHYVNGAAALEGATHGYSYWQSTVNYKSLGILMIGWLVVAVVLLGASLVCYRRRRSEVAGQTQPAGVFQLATKCFACFLGGAVTLMTFYDRSIPVKLLAILVGGVCVGLVAELLLSRSVKFLRRNLLWLAGTGVVCCAAFLLMTFDLFGYIGRVPETAKVSSVQLTYTGRNGDMVEVASSSRNGGYYYYGYGSGTITLTDPAAIEIVTAAHSKTVAGRRTGNDTYYADDIYTFWELSYSLKGGGTLSRRYHNINREAYQMLASLETNGDYLTQTYPLYVLDRYLLGAQSDYIRNAAYVDTLGNAQTLSLRGGQLDELLEAMMADAHDQPIESLFQPTGTTTGFVRLRYDEQRVNNQAPNVWLRNDEIWIELGDWSTRTAALLRQYGVDTAPDLSTVRAVYLTNSTGYRSDSDAYRVSTITPGNAAEYEYSLRGFLQGEEGYRFLEVESEADIRQVQAAAFNTAMLSSGEYGGALTVLYDLGEGGYSMQRVLRDDLPTALRAQADELFRVQTMVNGEMYYGDYYYNHYDSWLAEDLDHAIAIAEGY